LRVESYNNSFFCKKCYNEKLIQLCKTTAYGLLLILQS